MVLVKRVLTVLGIVILLIIGAFLYADLQSIHQIYPISQSMIDGARDELTRDDLIIERDRRIHEDGTAKMKVEAALAVDVVVLLGLALTFPRAE